MKGTHCSDCGAEFLSEGQEELLCRHCARDRGEAFYAELDEECAGAGWASHADKEKEEGAGTVQGVGDELSQWPGPSGQAGEGEEKR